MEDTQKLREVEKAIQEAVKVHLDNLKDISEKSGCFKYVESENMDEPFNFKIEGIEFTKMHEDYVECQEKDSVVDTALKDKFDTEVDRFINDSDFEWNEEQTKELKRLLLLAQATIISDIEEALSDKNMEQIETNLKNIKIEGFEYDCWEETELLFSVDNVKYRMGMWDGELSNVETGLTISEMESK